MWFEKSSSKAKNSYFKYLVTHFSPKTYLSKRRKKTDDLVETPASRKLWTFQQEECFIEKKYGSKMKLRRVFNDTNLTCKNEGRTTICQRRAKILHAFPPRHFRQK